MPRIRIIAILIAILSSLSALHAAETASPRVVVAYVTSWSDDLPDPNHFTHLNYAFGAVSPTFDSVTVDNPERFRTLANLKKAAPHLKVLLSVGGWGSGRFSEMASDADLRARFAASCRRLVDTYGIDGIDIDWEYPGSDAAGISSSPDDPANFTLLIKELRKALGDDRLLTLASAASGTGLNFKDFVNEVDFINMMTYDMARPPLHHASLHRSQNTGEMTVESAVKIHTAAGVPLSKLVLGVPFYGRGIAPYTDFVNFDKITVMPGCTEHWDSVAKVPYITDGTGKLVLGYENAASLDIKCDYVDSIGMRGMMYWEYSGDSPRSELRRKVADRMLGSSSAQLSYPANYAKAPRFKALLHYSDTAEPAHVEFAEQAIEFFHRLTYGEGYILDKTTSLAGYTYDRLKEYNLLIQINTSATGDEQREAFEKYMENGGGWLGFHAAAYNDGNTRWEWFNKFLGAGHFLCNNWPPQPALLEVNTPGHAVTKNLPSEFVAPECEWYQWQSSPTTNPNVDILLSLSPKNYPIGIKDIVYFGDFPVVWSNRDYRMVYLNIGHGDREFTDATQNLLIVNAFRWIVSMAPDGNPFER